MRIVIDMQGAQTQSRYRGIGRYAMSLTEAIIRNKAQHEIVLVLNGMLTESVQEIKDYFIPLVGCDQIYVWRSVGPTCYMNDDNRYRRSAGEIIREQFIDALRPDVLLLTTFFEGFDDNFICSVGEKKSYITAAVIYDLIPLLNPEKYLTSQVAQNWYFERVEQIKRADLLLSISDYTKAEVVDNLKFDPEKVVSISSAVSDDFRPLEFDAVFEAKIRLKFNIRDKYIMYAGATDERKNHLGLLDAYSKLSSELRSQYQLVFAGGLPAEHREKFMLYAKKLSIKDDELVITGRVSDQELLFMYNNCSLFVFPSFHEGFGLPALEAMKCGAAVVGSNLTSLPEVIGNHDALFDPHSAERICQKITEVISDQSKLAQLEEWSLKQSKLFSWDRTSVRAINAFEGSSRKFLAREVGCDFYLSFSASGFVDAISRMDENELRLVSCAIAENEKNQRMRQLLLDVSELVMNPDRMTGIQRVVANIVLELMNSPPLGYRVELVYARVVENYVYARKFKSKLMGYDIDVLEEEPVSIGVGDVFIGLDMVHPAVMKSDFYRSLREGGASVYFVVYDLLPLEFPEFVDDVVREGFLDWINEIVNYKGVVCISRDVSEKISIWLNENRPDIVDFENHVFKLGANFPAKGAFLKSGGSRLKIPNNGINLLMVGTIEPRKGHSQVLDAFVYLWRAGYNVNLIFIGRQGWKVENFISEILQHEMYSKRLFWFEGVDDAGLHAAYSECDGVIIASYGEGFGLPLVEAAAHKIPIIARNLNVFHEVAKGHAYYFSADGPEDLAKAIECWLELFKNNAHPKSDQLPWLTWRQSAQQLLAAVGLPHEDTF